ncbi:MAG: ester cyclase [Candidatus Binatia bacterium]
MRKILAITLVSLLLIAVGIATAKAGKFGGKTQIAECFHFCIFIDYDTAVADELLSPDFAWHYGFVRALAAPGQNSFFGPDAIAAVKLASDALNAGFSELGVVHDVVFSHGDLVEVRWTASGIHNGPLLGFDPTGCKVIFTGNDLFRIKHGKIVELWQETDLADLTRQLDQEPCD